VLGRIADHHDVKPAWSDEGARPYAYAEQLVWRDIDPTVLARKPSDPSTSQDLWFSPAEARFPPGTPEDYPADMSGIPDPLDLIAVTDASERPWLVLVSIPTWAEMKAHMKDHLDLTLREALARLQGRYADDIAAYDEIHVQILGMADMLSDRIIAQFPNKFAH
jgi:hypothetical protein